MKTCVTAMTAASAVIWLMGTSVQAQSNREAPPEMQAEQQACEADVYALCGEFIPDVDRITACLRSRWKDVSQSCRAVMASYGRKNQNGRRDRRD
jgi:hypothetical protein